MQNLILQVYDGLYSVQLDQVLYFEADDHYCQVRYYSGFTFMLPFGLSVIENQIALTGDLTIQQTFRRLGRRYVINLRYIHQISTITQQLSFVDATAARITIKASKVVLRELIDYIGNLNRE